MNEAAIRRRFDPSLYFITDDRSSLATTLDLVQQIAPHGITLVQLRDKQRKISDLLPFVRELKAILDPWRIPLIINDSIELAEASAADGVHLGVADATAAEARARLGHSAIVGVTANTRSALIRIDPAVVDYVGIGAVYRTRSKAKTTLPIGIQGLLELLASATVPVVAIGGITPKTAKDIYATGVAGIAVIAAIANADDPVSAVEQFLAAKRSARDGKLFPE